eukprot:766769-Hanusia_phi.AAC.3
MVTEIASARTRPGHDVGTAEAFEAHGVRTLDVVHVAIEVVYIHCTAKIVQILVYAPSHRWAEDAIGVRCPCRLLVPPPAHVELATEVVEDELGGRHAAVRARVRGCKGAPCNNTDGTPALPKGAIHPHHDRMAWGRAVVKHGIERVTTLHHRRHRAAHCPHLHLHGRRRGSHDTEDARSPAHVEHEVEEAVAVAGFSPASLQPRPPLPKARLR